jgi:hypothetical protein
MDKVQLSGGKIMRLEENAVFLLHTLKARPFEEQIHTIEQLTEHNLDLYEEIRSLLETHSENSVIHLFVSTDRCKVIQVALLAIVAVDITTIPDQLTRSPFSYDLDRLCAHFAIDAKDLSLMVRHASDIENLLTCRV